MSRSLPATSSPISRSSRQPPAAAPDGVLPPVERFASHYVRYNGPIGRSGDNKTTHTAEVRFPGGPGLAVVKAFSIFDKGWMNEAIAWCLGRVLQVGVPPRAMVLAAAPSELANATEPEIALAFRQWGAGGPIVLWCASRLQLKPPQHVWRMNWEMAVLHGEAGRRLAAFDAWIGNCDRLDTNAPYWMSRGHVAAIDHERMVFNQDWFASPPGHMDRMGLVSTKLLHRLHTAMADRKLKHSVGMQLIAQLSAISGEHGPGLASIRRELEQFIVENVGAAAAANVLEFLSIRATDEFIRERLETLI